MFNDPIGLSDLIVWVFVTGVFSVWIYRRFTLTPALVFAFVVLSALRIFQNSFNGVPPSELIRLFDLTAESALLSFLLTLFAIQSFSKEFWMAFFKLFALLNALVIIGDKILHPHTEVWGLLFNASMSGCLNACVFPFFPRREKWLKILILISIITTGRSMPIAVLCAVIASGLFLQRKWKSVFALIPIGIITGFILKGHAFLDTRGRSDIWNLTFHYFKDNVSHIYGMGLGSFYVVGLYLSRSLPSTFTWLHSDWAQILFEMGAIGLFLVILLYVDALWRSRRAYALFSSLVGYGVFATANMPLRYPLAGLFGAFLIRMAFE